MKAGLLILGLMSWAPGLFAAAQPVGDAQRGRAVVLDRDLGHCILCHRIAQVDAPFQGNLGPDLSNVGARMTVTQMRRKIEDPTRDNPDSAMPSYFKTHGLRQVARDYRGQTVLTASQLADLLAFLATLRAGTLTHETDTEVQP